MLVREILFWVLFSAMAFGCCWMGYEQHVANHIMTGVVQMGAQQHPSI